ncbi:hypothetical protein IKF23_01995 [Candidatus Saccharibacteria bacterium]|nr:hypothetical protein [Candidatus Saccharibacteria bacterium]
MAYSGALLKINGTTINGLSGYKIGYNKLWKDADRNMNGDVRATLIGIFPKLELTFRDALTENEVSQIINLLDQPYFSVTYFSPKTKGAVTANYYASDYAPELLDKARGLYKSFTVSLVPVSKL